MIDMGVLCACFFGLCFLLPSVQAGAQNGVASAPHRTLMAELLIRHPAVQAALSQKTSAEHDTEGAKSQFLPTASVGLEKSTQSTNALTDGRTTFVRLQQPLWTGGRLTAQLDKARAQEELANLTVSEQRLNLATRWLQLWAEVQGAELKSQAFTESETQHLKYVRQVQNRAKEGHAPLSDVQLSLSRFAGVQAELEQAKAQRQQAISKLEQMYGGPIPGQALQSIAMRQAPRNSAKSSRNTDQWVTMAMDIHPSLQKSIVTVNVLRADAGLAKSRIYPEVYLRGEVIHRDVNKNSQQLYVGLTTNFGAGLSSLSSVASAQARVQAQEQDIEVKRRDIADQINADLQTVESQTQRLSYLVQAHDTAEQFMQSSERQFKEGRRTWQELMNTAREKAQVLALMADTQSTLWLAQERLALMAFGVEAYVQNNPGPP